MITKEQQKRLTELLTKLKKAHLVYLVCTEEQKGRLFDSACKLIDELVTFGRDRTFYEALLVSGEEFLLSEYGDPEEKIFGRFKEEMTEQEVKELAPEKKSVSFIEPPKKLSGMLPVESIFTVDGKLIDKIVY